MTLRKSMGLKLPRFRATAVHLVFRAWKRESSLMLRRSIPGRGLRDRALLAVLLYTGGRRAAICNIKVGHLLHEMGVHYVLLHEKGDRRIRRRSTRRLRNAFKHGWQPQQSPWTIKRLICLGHSTNGELCSRQSPCMSL